MYLVDGVLGIFIGSASAFYLDSLQVPVVIEKFKLYTSAGFSPMEYITYPLVNKWGRIDLGSYTGGSKLLFTESLAGVINWSIAAWLFAINKVFMLAFFEKHTAPIRFFFSRAGFAQLIEHMIYVLRWGLWMSPIIFTFLRMMPEPTWYNQDGAIRTIFALSNNLTMSPEAFNNWSLKIFIYILAFDFFRVLIWMDHMGLRVATLVNLSFIGLDRLDERVARFIGPATAQRYIPEAVKRFATWGPLLIPFYLPRGKEWDYAWSTSEAMQNAGGGGMLSALRSLALPEKLLLVGLAIPVCTGVSFGMRKLRERSRRKRLKTYQLGNLDYRVFIRENGEVFSEVDHKKIGVFPGEYDITRRSYDTMDPCGRILYLADTSQWHKSKKRYWPVMGNFPKERFEASKIGRTDDSLKVVNATGGIKTTINITLPDEETTAEILGLERRTS
jgi:cyclic beta-1,2-glucan synthetase